MALAADFRVIDPRDARVVLVEGGPRILPDISPRTCRSRRSEQLERLGVEVRLGAAVATATRMVSGRGGERIACRTLIWAAGVHRVAGREMAGRRARPRGRGSWSNPT